MTSHFRWYGDEAAPTVPFNRRYFFPEEANHAKKNIIKVQPRNPTTYSPTGTNEIRVDFPTDGFLDPKKTFLEFDVTLNYTPTTGDYSIIRFQNCIQMIFNRYREEYGATLLEEIQEYGKLARIITTHTGTGQTGGMDQMSIGDGVGGAAWGSTGSYSNATNHDDMRPGMVNARQAFIHGISLQKADAETGAYSYNLVSRNNWSSAGFGGIPNGVSGEGIANTLISVTRRYSVPILSGLMQQSKLIPLKFMAQLSAVFNLEQAAACIFWQKGESTTSGVITKVGTTPPSYSVSNVTLNCEVLHFDSQYNMDFMEGLKTGGVPIKFASFTHFQDAANQSTTQTITISEKARSVKAIFTAVMRESANIEVDNGASFSTTDSVGGSLVSFQHKVGTAYYPSQPVSCCQQDNQNVWNGGAEAYGHLQRALNMVGDSRLSTTADILNWGGPCGVFYTGAGFKYDTNATYNSLLNEYDGKYSVTNDENGKVILFECESSSNRETARTGSYGGRAFAGNWNSAQFVMAMSFDTSNGIEISGINALQQSDIMLTVKWSQPQRAGMTFHTWTYFDTMLLLLENNVVQTIK